MVTVCRPHILVVDDDPSIRDALRAGLAARYTVHTVATGGEAVALLQIHPIAAIVLDALLGPEHGLDFVERFRRVSSARIMLLTGHGSEELAMRAVWADVHGYLKKPTSLPACGNDVTYLRTLGLDETLARTDAVETVHYLAEALGSSVALANPAGGVATTYTYEPFGRTETTGTPNPNPYRFTGREDDGTGLYYYRARYYDPGRERFVSEDPIGLAGGLNPYAYVGANPLSFADPLGLWRWPGQVYNDAMVDAMGRFPLNTMHNGPGDAYRHCLASCIMTRENSETEATFLGWLNEVRGDWTHNQERGERQMDEYNNEAGRMCGRTATSTQDCRDRCLRTTLIQSYQGGSTPPYSQTGYYGNLR